MKLATHTISGKAGSLTVSDAIFGTEPNQQLIAQAVRVYRANERQGTSATKTRSMVARTTKKWFKQKGTGNARHGARSAPIFVGGGVAHGPKANQNWSLKLTKQMKAAAMRSALSAQAPQIIVADQIEKLDGKSKTAATLFTEMKLADKRVLVVLPEMTDIAVRSLRNLDNVLIATAGQVSVLEIAMANVIVTTSAAIKVLETRLETKKAAKETAIKTEATEKPKAKTEAKPAAKKPAAKPKTTKKTK